MKIQKYQKGKVIRSLAHTINEHGNTPIYKDGYDAWYSSLTGNNLAILRSDARRLYEQENGSLYPKDASFWEKMNPKYDQKALRWYYDTKLNSSRRDAEERRAGITASQQAAVLSLAGQAVGTVPTVYTRVAGALASIPDQVYDWAALIDTPSTSNAIHTALDYPELAKLTKTPYDDIAAYVVNTIGNIDDASSTAGKDLFSWINKSKGTKPLMAQSFDKMPAESTSVKPVLQKKGGTIHIKPENKGKFTALKKRTGKSSTWYKEHGTPAQKKMAIFALNAKHWNH